MALQSDAQVRAQFLHEAIARNRAIPFQPATSDAKPAPDPVQEANDWFVFYSAGTTEEEKLLRMQFMNEAIVATRNTDNDPLALANRFMDFVNGNK